MCFLGEFIVFWETSKHFRMEGCLVCVETIFIIAPRYLLFPLCMCCIDGVKPTRDKIAGTFA